MLEENYHIAVVFKLNPNLYNHLPPIMILGKIGYLNYKQPKIAQKDNNQIVI